MIVIRNATPNDVAVIAAIESECFPPSEAAEEAAIRTRIEAFPESFLVAEAHGEPIGFINGCVTNSAVINDDMFHSVATHAPDGKYQAVFGLDVLPQYQRQGIAALLMNAFIENARVRGKTGVILTCKTHLIHYYERFGFVNQGVSASTHGGATWYDMICPLDAGK